MSGKVGIGNLLIGKMQFQIKENKDRVPDFRKNQGEEDFLLALNNSLRDFEISQSFNKSRFPWIFVLGLPRSGTTLLMQTLATAFDFCMVNNFMARYYEAPVTGAQLSKILFGNNRFVSDFKSNHGKTKLLRDAHEWSYFWIDRLKYDRSVDFNRSFNEGIIEWKDIQLILDQMTHVFQKPFLNKALHPAKYIRQFLKMNPDILFIYIERDFFENCQSIKKSRERYFDDPNTWWSLIPDNFEDISKLPYYKQIPEQLFGLHNEMITDLDNFTQEKFIRISYNDLCSEPHAILDHISNKLKLNFKSDFGYSLDHIPGSFSQKKRHQIDPDMKQYILNEIPELK